MEKINKGESGTTVIFNKTFDLGNLLISDITPILPQNEGEKKLEEGIKIATERASSNFRLVLQELYKLWREQKLKTEHLALNYDAPTYMVTLPAPTTVLPRARPIPKQKPMTKWEKFRSEKGIPVKTKRSRKVFDEITQEWVPRWGARSVKKIKDQANWIIEHKDGQEYPTDPFTMRSQEKKLASEKQKLREIKNEMRGQKDGEAGLSRLNEERKGINRTLEIAQRSTASMGKFDKKSHKKEADVKPKNKRQRIEFNHKQGDKEKERNKKILERLTGGQGDEPQLNVEKMVRKHNTANNKKRENIKSKLGKRKRVNKA